MAPRRRPRKVGQSRMDAAIDALTPMGYSKNLIQRKVNALLKVYDGEWRFIEESAYQVLIDAILEEQEQEYTNKKNEAMEDGDSASDSDEYSNAHNDAEPSNAHDVAEPSGARDVAEPSGARDVEHPNAGNGDIPGSSGKTGEVLTDDTTCVRQAGERLERRNISCMNHDFQQEMAPVKADDDNGIRGLRENGLRGAAELIPRRKPCYGFIGSDDDDGFVYFETEASQRKEMNRNKGCQKERKIKWDVK
ncbi:hypothetical protein FRX31_030382 [Thalictrum thalictroides]|uniref:WIYLD domain-containing protein n=1 Tax=Thalictrum thalictroides TaxID=46969 RepID=A0A7J6V5R4_THATH|nr:hypothetical protein FRX31_030382 [Thalictrum thalictroides]